MIIKFRNTRRKLDTGRVHANRLYDVFNPPANSFEKALEKHRLTETRSKEHIGDLEERIFALEQNARKQSKTDHNV